MVQNNTVEKLKAFISYSWSSSEHKKWVLELAEQLCEDGIDIQLDKWDLKEGNDKYLFMEKMVTDPEIKKVIIVSDKIYAEKADQRIGGVGTETQIITPELYDKTGRNKFVVVTTQKDKNGNAYVPSYYKSKIYIDLSDEDNYNKNYEQLLRWLFDKPVYQKPKIGKPPAFLFDDNPISIGTKTQYTRCINAIRDSKANALGCFDEYCNVVIDNLELFRMDFGKETEENPADEIFYKNVTSLLAVRDEILNVIAAIINYIPNSDFIGKMHNFFEKIINYNKPPKKTGFYQRYASENYEQFNYQLFLYTVALFIRYERFNELNTFLLQRFLTCRYNDKKENCSYLIFNYSENILLHKRNERLSLNNISLLADYLHNEWKHKTITHDEIIQTEILLYIYASIKIDDELLIPWFPHNLIFLNYRKSIDILIKAESRSYLKKLSPLLTIDDLNNFNKSEYSNLSFGGAFSYSIRNLINIEKLGTIK